MNQQALYAFAVESVGELVGGIMFGVIIDKIGNRNATVMNVFLSVLCLGATTYNILYMEFGIQSWVMCLLWGYEKVAVFIWAS